MQPQAKDCQRTPRSYATGMGQTPPEPPEGTSPTHTLTLEFWPPELGQ